MLKKRHKYVFIVGGVMSGVGKGIVTSSIGAILSSKGFNVNLVKADPYLNVDAGTMNPTEHGEVFVLNSGLETDQDMGNYERFLNRDLQSDDYMTSGMVYKSVIEKERSLHYGGKCVEAVPHVRDEITNRIIHAGKVNKSDLSIIEIGGTIGDYQNVMFIEAARVMKMDNPNDVMVIMVSYLPVPQKLGEMKSRPTQNAARQLSSYGLNADMIIARSELPIDKKRKEKIAVSCNIPTEYIISAPDVDSIYDVPGNFDKDGLGEKIMKILSLSKREGTGLVEWNKVARGIKNHSKNIVKIAMVGKYFSTGEFVLNDAYLSVFEAIKFSAYKAGVKAVIEGLDATYFEKKKPDFSVLKKYDGVIIPGGFGKSGIAGKLNVIRYARENKIPCFGLCYGMQLMTIEYARNVIGFKDANTHEINPHSKHLVIDIMPDQRKRLRDRQYGGTMRLGLYPARIKKGTLAATAYKTDAIAERHRHRYEVNPEYIQTIEKGGLVFSGKSPDGKLMEIAELPKEKHPFFLGTQFHPEFLARPIRPHPLFTAFMKAAKQRKTKNSSKI